MAQLSKQDPDTALTKFVNDAFREDTKKPTLSYFLLNSPPTGLSGEYSSRKYESAAPRSLLEGTYADSTMRLRAFKISSSSRTQ